MNHPEKSPPAANLYKKAEFLLSVNNYHQLPDNAIEIAFAGRSNAGKSSAINAITEIKNLCRTSKTPGRTQMINYFAITPDHYLVDLPGYGYAKVPLQLKQHWQKLLERYLIERQALRAVILIMDVRHPLTPYDKMMLNWAKRADMQTHILLTKADKLKTGAANNTLLQVKKILSQESPGTTVQLFSAINKMGVDNVRLLLDQWFEFDTARSGQAE